jgi:hypothetical protein
VRFLSVILCFFTFNSYSATYGDLAAKHVDSQMKVVVDGLYELDERSTPVSTKKLRKDIGKLKIFLDVFTYAYETQLVLKIRKDLDVGYEVVGNFKDLHDTYDENDLTDELIESRRKLALKWKEKFLDKLDKHDYKKYLASPLISKVAKRNKSDLAKFFWGIVKFPKKKIIDGDKVIKSLINNMMEISEDRLEGILKLKDLFSYKRENEYHDFRKLVRAHLKLVNVFFSDTLATNEEMSMTYQKLSEVVSSFGDLNDKLVKFHHVEGKRKKKELEKAISKEWKKLKKLLKDEKVGKLIFSFKL